MDNKGFTIVELIAVMAVLVLLIVLVVPAINGSSNKTKAKIYQSKVEMIEKAAIIYGQDNYKIITTTGNKQTIDEVEYRTFTVKVKDLIPEYYTADNNTEGSLVIDPRDNTKFLDEKEVIIKINMITRKVTADFNE